MKNKNVVGVMAAVRVTMTVQLAANVTELALSLLKKNLMIAMTLTNWPFPPFPNPLDKGNKVPKFNPDNFEDAPYVTH